MESKAKCFVNAKQILSEISEYSIRWPSPVRPRAHFAVLVQRAKSTLGTCRPTGYAEAAYRDRSRVLCLPRRIAHVSLLLQEPPARPPFVLAKGVSERVRV